MTDAKRDNNQITTILGTSSTDGSTPVPVKVNPTSHYIVTDIGITGTDLSGDDAKRDNNGVPVMLGVSSDDGITPVPVYVNPATGGLLIKLT